MNLYFDDHGHPVPSVGFEFPNDEPADGAVRYESLIAQSLTWVCNAKTVSGAGERVLLVAYLAGMAGVNTQRLLARKLGKSEATVSAKLKALRRYFARPLED